MTGSASLDSSEVESSKGWSPSDPAAATARNLLSTGSYDESTGLEFVVSFERLFCLIFFLRTFFVVRGSLRTSEISVSVVVLDQRLISGTGCCRSCDGRIIRVMPSFQPDPMRRGEGARGSLAGAMVDDGTSPAETSSRVVAGGGMLTVLRPKGRIGLVGLNTMDASVDKTHTKSHRWRLYGKVFSGVAMVVFACGDAVGG